MPLIEGHKADDKRKIDWDYTPMEVLPGVARVFQLSSKKHKGKRTWFPGIRYSKIFSAIWRHLFEWYYLGHDTDEETPEHPLCYVIANCMMLLSYIENKDYDDRPKRSNYEISKTKYNNTDKSKPYKGITKY